MTTQNNELHCPKCNSIRINDNAIRIPMEKGDYMFRCRACNNQFNPEDISDQNEIEKLKLALQTAEETIEKMKRGKEALWLKFQGTGMSREVFDILYDNT